jgi:hypothetical protein
MTGFLRWLRMMSAAGFRRGFRRRLRRGVMISRVAPMEIHIGQILAFLSQAAVGAIFVLGFIGLAPAKLGDRIFGHYLERRLAALRHDQSRQIEKLRAELALVGDRGIRSNEKEFQAITAAWEHFLDAYGATMECAIAFRRYPDFRKLSEMEVKQYLESTEITDRQREAVMTAADKNATFSRLVEINQIHAAGVAIYNARNLIGRQAIFIPDDLLALFEATMKKLSEAQIQRSMEPHYGAYSELKGVEWLVENGERERVSLLAAVRQRILPA